MNSVDRTSQGGSSAGSGAVNRFRRGLSAALMVAVQATFVASTLLLAPIAVAPVAAANPSASLDQCANDPAPSPATDGCDSSAAQWVNGNLGASKSVYREGDSIPYRLTFGNLAISSGHTVTIEWDTTKAGKHAIDYLTTYNRTVANANPCLGVSGCVFANSSLFAIPKDPQVDNGSGSPITQTPGNFTIWGGTITAASIYSYSHGTGFAGDKSASIVITFSADVANPVIAWGGHIATRHDWGPTSSAVAISGSPYHTRLLDLDGSGGNQDRSLSAAAVIFPGQITIVKNTTGGNSTFAFTASPTPLPATFSITTVGGTGNQVFPIPTQFTTYTVTESTKTGWDLTGIVCAADSGTVEAGSTSTSGRTATIDLKEGDFVTCTYSNSPTPAPALTIVKKADVSTFTKVGDVINYTITATNTGNVTLHAVNVTDSTGLDSFTCVPTVPVASLAPAGTIVCTGSHTIVQADMDAGQFVNTACAKSTEADAGCDTVTVTTTKTATLTLTKTDNLNPAKYDHVGQVVTYTLTATNSGNVTLHNVTVSDVPALDGFSCTPSIPVASLAPGASVVCTGTHTITQGDLDARSFTDTGSASSDEDTAPDAPDTVNGAPPTVVGQITPTATTCDQFSSGTAATLTDLNYSIKAGKVAAVNPGVFFYWITVTAVSGSNTFTITQTQNDTFPHFFDQASGTFAYSSGCTKVSVQNISTSNGITTVTFTAPSAGTYIIGIKYDSKSVQGFAAPSGDVLYTFETSGVPGSSQILNLNHP